MSRFSLMRHRHRATPVNVSPFATSARTTERIDGPPWHSMHVKTKGQRPGSRSVAPGDWLALSSERGASFWARVEANPGRAEFGGDKRTVNGEITCHGWFDLFGAADLIAVPGAASTTIGTLFNFDDWVNNIFKPLVDSAPYGNLGTALRAMLRRFVAVNLPASMTPELSGQNIGEFLLLLADQDTSDLVGAGVTVDPVLGFNLAAIRSSQKTQSKVLEFLRSTFVPSPMLVEMFPTFVRAGRERASEGAPILGLYPALVYRVRPWRPEPLADSIARGREGLERAQGQSFASSPIDVSAFSRVTWDERKARTIKDVKSVTFGQNDSQRVNATSAWLSSLPRGDELRVMEGLGLPFLGEGIGEHGLRASWLNWPLFAPVDQSGGPNAIGNVIEHVRALAAQVFQFYANAHEFESGIVTAGFDPFARVGEVIRIPFNETSIIAYSDSVEHSYEFEGDALGTRTTIHYSRGLIAGASRFVGVPVPDPPIVINEPARLGNTGDRREGIVFGGNVESINYPIHQIFSFGDTDPQHAQPAPGDRVPSPRADWDRFAAERYPTFRKAESIRYIVIHSGGDGIRGGQDLPGVWRAEGISAQYIKGVRDHGGSAAHFIIDTAGNIWQLGDALRYAAHTVSHDYPQSSVPPETAASSTDYINRHSVGITLAVSSSSGDATTERIKFWRDQGYQLVGDQDWIDGPIVETQLHWAGPELPPAVSESPTPGLNPLGRHVVWNGPQLQISLSQFKALGALVGCICRNTSVLPLFPGQGSKEYIWKRIEPLGANRTFDAKLEPGIYIHPTLNEERRDHLAINRTRLRQQISAGIL